VAAHAVGTGIAAKQEGPPSAAIQLTNAVRRIACRESADVNSLIQDALPTGRLYKVERKGARMGNLKEQNPHSEREEKDVDKAVEDSFPASDPPSTGGVTRIETDDEKGAKKQK
jgi:hypothetical protein